MASFNQSPLGQTTISTSLGTAVVSGSFTVINVTNSGSGAFVVNSVSNPTLSLVRGSRYSIVINATGHPFWIQTVSGAYSPGNIYNTGVTNNGTDNGTIVFDVPVDAPQLYYACQYHSSMAGSITTSESVSDADIIAFIPTSVVDATGGTPTWYAPSSAVQSEGRRESKMIGLPPSGRA
jgi:hypothetical protein